MRLSPTPWRANSLEVVDAENALVADIACDVIVPVKTAINHARLIAAAPDLEEALVDLLSYHDVPGPVDAPLRPLMDAAFAALRKAGRLS